MWRLQQWNWKCGQDQPKSKRTGLLSYAATDPNYLYLDDYNSDLQPGECNPVQQVNFSVATQHWMYTDFILSGYDPDNHKTVFQVATSPFAKGNIQADLTARLSGEGTITAETDGTDGVKTVGDAFKSVGDLFSKDDNSDGKKEAKVSFIKWVSGVGSFLGTLADVGSLFKYLVGIFPGGNETNNSVKRFNISSP
ncbi:hypothetical protein GO730_18615 [Spirosoma sp. HMF3257]|nr:hypothetical protein [Spirosoma telluris]